MRFRPLLAVACVALYAALIAPSFASAAATPVTWNVLSNPIIPGELAALPFGTSSYWLQPWRSSLVTQPATSLESAIGINFNVKYGEAMATARLLHDSGIHRARLEISWNQMSYANPSQLANPAPWTQYITALRDYGIRPLILVNGDPGGPEPNLPVTLTLTAGAAAGATTISLSHASVAQIVPGLTGITLQGVMNEVLITSVTSAGVATLSQPLPVSLPAGAVTGATFKYEPFAPPDLASGAPNPRFQQTLAGWLNYVKAVGHFVAGVYGSDNFDIEVWNESQTFVYETNYFNPIPDLGSTGNTSYAILQATVQMLQNPANGLTDVKVGDGFADQVPWFSGASVPPGTAAIDHHPYKNPVDISPATPSLEPGIGLLDALGVPVSRLIGQPVFIPTYRAFFPEYYLSGIQTETLMRDLSPTVQSDVYGTPHGAMTHQPGSPPPANWITEDNLDHNYAMADGMPAADLPEMQAKAAMRFYLSYASEGAQAIDLYGAAGGSCCQIIPQAFFNAVDAHPSSYPASLAGPTMAAMARLSYLFSDAQPIAQPRQLTLTSIAQYGNTSQFTGNGTTAYPDLYDRDVLAFFPFQVSPNIFVAAVYVMTQDLTHYYTSSPAPGLTPYDMPPEAFQLTIGNVDGANASVWLYDPLTGTEQPAAIVSRSSNQIVVQLAATDSPRLLTINDGTAATDTPAQAAILRLTAPRKVAASTALRRGLSLSVRCGLACPAQITASPAGSRGAHPRVYGRSTARTTASGVAHLTLRMNSAGRAWLRTQGANRLSITARNSAGAVVSKTVVITRPPAPKKPKKR